MATYWPSSVISKPQKVFMQDLRWEVARTPYDAGYVQTFARWTTSKRVFRLRWTIMTSAEVQALTTHYRERKGPAGAFEWAHPISGTTYQVRFADESMSIKYVGPAGYEVAIDLEQI